MRPKNLIAISTGPLLFSFASFDDWCQRGQQAYRQHNVRSGDVIARDQLGRLVDCGGDFMAATAADAYPVDVYLRRPPVEPSGT